MTEGQALVETQRELRDMEARAEKAAAALTAAETEIAKSNRALLQYEMNKRAVAEDRDAERDEWRRIVTGLLSLPDGPDSRVGDRSSILVVAAHDAVKSSGESSGALGRLFAQRDEALAKVATARAVMAEESAQRCQAEVERLLRRGPASISNARTATLLRERIRALAPLPAGLCVLTVEVVARVRTVVRTGRWGTCVACPRLDGEVRPERCAFTERYDHNLPTDNLLAALDATGGERKTIGTDVELADAHHAKHRDMDGTTCLLKACARHYPKARGPR